MKVFETLALGGKKYSHTYSSGGIPGNAVTQLSGEIEELKSSTGKDIHNIVTSCELSDIQYLKEFHDKYFKIIKQ